MWIKIVRISASVLSSKSKVRSTSIPHTRCLKLCTSSSVNNIGNDATIKNNLYRTHKCGEVKSKDVGSYVKISGWLEYKRGNKFFTLRDSTGNLQVICDSEILLPTKESVVEIEGKVQFRPEKDKNQNMDSGDIEIQCATFNVLNRCKHLPVGVSSFSQSKEEVRMRYRYIDLRTKMMQHNLRLRSSFVLKLRRYLCEEQNFVDVETPTLFCKTPGGAKEFVVPTQTPGKFYSLPQSPQQFKQLLMVGGIDRYMQVARCYRDEGAKPDRQPEFTQLDLELSFINQQEIKDLIEDMMSQCWPEDMPSLTVPFPRLSYNDAMEMYGTDKPDTRFGSIITDITDELSAVTIFRSSKDAKCMSVKAININDGKTKLTLKQIKQIQQTVQDQYSVNVGVVRIGENGTWNSPLTKYLDDDTSALHVNEKMSVSNNDILFICADDSWKTACEALGKCRNLASFHSENNGNPLFTDGKQFNFLWVENFPLFELENSELHSAHHPFTAPLDEDFHLLHSDPSTVRGQHYDLVLNGSEIGGGSIRIHDSDTQRYVLETILKEDTQQLEHLLQALDSGCPPHGGIALGLDRLLSIMCNAPSIRDVIAFPKSSEGADLMTHSPSTLTKEDLESYHISIAEKPL